MDYLYCDFSNQVLFIASLFPHSHIGGAYIWGSVACSIVGIMG